MQTAIAPNITMDSPIPNRKFGATVEIVMPNPNQMAGRRSEYANNLGFELSILLTFYEWLLWVSSRHSTSDQATVSFRPEAAGGKR